jgi:hypothetical protein
MILQCRVCRSEITAAAYEPVFINLRILLGWMPFHMVMGLARQCGFFGIFVWLLLGVPVLAFVIVGVIFWLCWELLKGAVYLTSFFWKCPTCGSRRWTWPRTGPVAFP